MCGSKTTESKLMFPGVALTTCEVQTKNRLSHPLSESKDFTIPSEQLIMVVRNQCYSWIGDKMNESRQIDQEPETWIISSHWPKVDSVPPWRSQYE